MRTQDFERLYNNFINKPMSKKADFSTLNREDKISHLASALDFNPTDVVLSTTKEIEISKLSKDHRFQLIGEAAQKGDMDLVTRLSTCQGSANVVVSVNFVEASMAAQLAYLEKEYINTFGSLPTEVEVEILGGENFLAFIEYCNTRIADR